MTEEAEPSTGGRVAVVLGFVLHVAMGGVILVSGLIMPPYAVAALGVVWLAGLWIAIRSRARPAIVALVPVAMFAVWLATAYVGDALLDWTA